MLMASAVLKCFLKAAMLINGMSKAFAFSVFLIYTLNIFFYFPFYHLII